MNRSKTLTIRVKAALLAMAALLVIGIMGCTESKTESSGDNKGNSTGTPVAKVDPGRSKEPAKSEHQMDDTIDGFWCEPHGLPEDECWKCNKAFCRECEAKGDWCKEHSRPKSQCFKCDPTLIAKWAKVYEDLTGKKAPKPKVY